MRPKPDHLTLGASVTSQKQEPVEGWAGSGWVLEPDGVSRTRGAIGIERGALLMEGSARLQTVQGGGSVEPSNVEIEIGPALGFASFYQPRGDLAPCVDGSTNRQRAKQCRGFCTERGLTRIRHKGRWRWDTPFGPGGHPPLKQFLRGWPPGG